MVVSTNTAIIQGVYGESATITFASTASVAIESFQVFLINDTTLIALACGVGNGFEIADKLPHKLKERIIVSYVNNKSNITVTTLQYTDEFQPLGKAFREEGPEAFSEEAFSSLEVFG